MTDRNAYYNTLMCREFNYIYYVYIALEKKQISPFYISRSI